jgi:hypothetical protein
MSYLHWTIPMPGISSTMSNSTLGRLEREALFYEVISHMLSHPDVTAAKVADLLHLSIRQVFRLKAKVQSPGVTSLEHGNRGQRPANARPDRLRQQVVQLYARSYSKPAYNYAHFTEALADEHSIRLSPETVRRWLIEDGQGQEPQRYHHHRRHRRRCARRGEMLFLDGSPHRWLGTGHPRITLILASDDATGEPCYGLFEPQESRNGCFEVLYHVARQYGLPQVLYLDRAGQFTTTRHGGIHRQQRDDQPTAFEIAMQRLGVKLIFADSPQARGRGERLNRSFQGRLVAELAHQGIQDMSAATVYLNERFIPGYRKRFAVAPRAAEAAFRPVPEGTDLRRTLCAETIRVVTSDNTISMRGFRYQLRPPQSCRTLCFCRVTVQEWFDGTIHVVHPHMGEIPVELIPSDRILKVQYWTRHNRL